MIKIGRLASLVILTGFGMGLTGCIYLEDSATQYIQSSDKVTLSAGNAKDANAAIHILDPWPRASASRRIPANGERMAGAYERYRDVNKQTPRPMINPPVLGTLSGGAGGAGGGAATGGGAAAPAR